MKADQSPEHRDPSGPYGRAATDYLTAGWHPIPLPPGQKSPPPEGFTGYKGRAVTEADVAAWCNGARLPGGGLARLGNVALRPPLDVIGLDVDHYLKGGKAKRGGDTLAAAEARLGPLPATVRSTAREGDRVSGIRFYRVPPGRCWASELGDGVELIHHGHRYAVAWPSTNPDAGGACYRWHDDRAGGVVLDGPPSTAELPELPGSWVDHLDRGAVDDRPAKATEVGLEVPGGDPCPYVARLVDALRAKLAGGGSRHDVTLRAVLRVVRAGEQGHRGALAALGQAEALFLDALRGESSARRRAAPGDFARMRTGAFAKVAAAPTSEDLRGCCGEDSRRAGLEWEFVDDAADDDSAGTARTGEPGTGTAAGEPDAEAEFWRSRPFLSAVLRFARARRIGPWALLGAVLARAAACVPPSVVLPATIGSVASLNLFVALCAESGGGKSVAMAAARDFLDATGGTADYLETSPGSGEGLLGAYCYVHTEKGKGKAPEVRQTRLSVLFDIDEVSALAALLTRTSSTLLPFLKSAWSGSTLATQNAEAARQRHVGEHRYRLALVVGVQPANAGPILDDAAGGFPQRFLWLPTYDPGRLAPGEVLPDPLPWRWQVPAAPVMSHDGVITWPLRREVAVPEVARLAMHRADAERQRPIGSAAVPAAGGELDGHALLTRAKVAALLALLDDRADAFTEADWSAAGVILAKSDETRRAVIRVRGAEEHREADRRATRAGRSAALAADAEAETKTLRAMAAIRRALARADGGELSAGALGRVMGSPYRTVRADALDRLAASGEVLAEDRHGRGGGSTVYRLARGAAAGSTTGAEA